MIGAASSESGTLAAAALLRLATEGAVDEHVSHCLRCDREQMRAPLELERLSSDETQVGLVHESSRVERVTRLLGAQTMMGDATKLVVDERNHSDRR